MANHIIFLCHFFIILFLPRAISCVCCCGLRESVTDCDCGVLADPPPVVCERGLTTSLIRDFSGAIVGVVVKINYYYYYYYCYYVHWPFFPENLTSNSPLLEWLNWRGLTGDERCDKSPASSSQASLVSFSYSSNVLDLGLRSGLLATGWAL